MVEIAYKPLEPFKSASAQAPLKIDIPNYPDAGVSYAGYSKKIFSNEIFKLNKQTPFDFNFDWLPAAGVTTTNFILSQSTDKHYLTDMFITCWPNSVNKLKLQDGVVGRTVFWILNQNISSIQSYNVHFTVPIQLTNNMLTAVLSAPAVATDEYVVNFYGWSEPD